MNFIKSHKIAFILLIVSVGGLIVYGSFDNTPEEVEEDVLPTVEIRSVRDLSLGDSGLDVIGQVKSSAEANLKTQAQGEIVNVYYKIGDQVSTGSIIAEIENSTQRASVLQAKAGVKSAKAQLSIAKSGSTSNLSNFLVSFRNAYSVADDAVRNKVDQLFDSDDSLTSGVNWKHDEFSLRVSVNQERRLLNDIFEDWLVLVNNPTDDTDYLFNESKKNLERVRVFLYNVSLLTLGELNGTTSISQDVAYNYKTNVSLGRNSVGGVLTSLIGSYTALTSEGSGDSQSVLIAEASLDQAQAGLLLAEASLEKTLIRTPISGEINAIYVEKGDFVSFLQDAAVVANNDALEIEAYISENDRSRVLVDSPVLVSSMYKGTVTAVSPALDPVTKKVKVTVGLLEEVNLTNGESVNVSFENREDREIDTIIIPLSAIKIGSSNTVAFSVKDSFLVAHPVSVGTILGNSIIIEDGLSLDMDIVLDARGLSAGEKVEIK
ncbi:MAG: HlyD family efflux transporter periplasmic adaptor subunit [Candidatus Pacebacteria bacterium]|nr:HlyD family efflux transporter periplasmic adaptor subunit [Candidatus Paceibacterota bacterium]